MELFPEFSKSQRLRRVNTALAGAEAALPDTYGMSAVELPDLMNQLKDINVIVRHLPTAPH
jgi:hypothetical protein